MKKLILIPILFLFHFCNAGTGSAYDGQFLILAIVTFLLSIVLVIFLIGLIRKMIKKRRENIALDESNQTTNNNSIADTSGIEP